MKNFFCQCGQRIFFDNTRCTNCGWELGFDPQALTMLPLQSLRREKRMSQDGKEWRHCGNRSDYDACNWLVPANQAQRYCTSCQMSAVVPNLAEPENVVLWSRLESAKRRLLYSLLSLSLPIWPMGKRPGLVFHFLEDQRRNPDVLEPFVSTGHVDGTITINIMEADSAARHEVREQMHERYRTVLGHLRHEVGHYYLDRLIQEGPERDQFRLLFGDERTPYEPALEAYYRDGVVADWWQQYVSAYASAHPHEDWAETFAHYLHIRDALETADASCLISADAGQDWILRWISLSVTLNELNRSLGIDDPYPFVLPDPVIEKLRFTHLRVISAS